MSDRALDLMLLIAALVAAFAGYQLLLIALEGGLR